MLARDGELPDADARLHRIGLVDDHDPARGGRWLDGIGRGQCPPRPRAERLLRRRERFVARDVANDGEKHVVRNEVLTVERLQIGARQRGERLLRAAPRQPVRVEPVDEPIEHDIRDVTRVVCVHAQRRQDLVLLPLDLLRRERRIARHIGHQIHADLKRVLHDNRVHEREIGPGAGAKVTTNEINLIGDLLGTPSCGSLIQKRCGEVGHAPLSLRILRCPCPHQQADADGGLLVMQDDHHLHAVGQGADLVGRKRGVMRGKRTRRRFGRPVASLREC